MTMNRIGKSLVFIHLVLSLLALAGAASIFLQFTDWGWVEPRKELDYRIPSEYDKRSAALKEAIRGRDGVYPAYKPVQAAWRDAEDHYPQNDLWYDQQIARLKSDPNPIEVKEIKYIGGVLDLDTPGKPIGKPVLENPVPGVQKSFTAYLEDLQKLKKEADAVALELGNWIVKAKDITFHLNGKDDTGKKVKTGLYELVENETSAQAQIRFEMEYLQPYWVDALKEAEIYRVRRQRLEEAILRAQKALPKN